MRSSGWSLLELVIVLSIVAIIGAFIPGITHTFYARYQLQSISTDIHDALEFAKNQAILSGSNVYIGPLDDDRSWKSGLKAYVLKPKPQTLHYWSWNFPHWQIIWKGFYSDQQLIFSPNPWQAKSNGRFILSHLSSGKKVEYVVNRLGKIRETSYH